MKIYNKYLDQAVRTIDSVKPTSGFEKTKEFKKNLEIKKLEKQLGKKPTTQKFNKGGRVGKKFGGGADMGSKKLSPKQMKIASLAGNKKKIDAPDFKKLRAMKSPISQSVRKS